MTLHYPAIEAVGIAAREPLAGLAFRPVSAQLPASNPDMSPSCLPAGKFMRRKPASQGARFPSPEAGLFN
jgi:hypothetical protein